jgi:hypothetical protein
LPFPVVRSWGISHLERELRSITAHNTKESNKLLLNHQPGGTGLICTREILQCERKPSVDEKGLRRWFEIHH